MFVRVILSICVFMLYSAICKAQTITFVAEDLPPYHFINQNNEPDGALIDLAKATIKHTKLTAKFEIMPMARIFYALEHNPNAVTLSLLKTPIREKQLTWLGESYFADAYLVSLKSHTDEVSHLNHAKFYQVATIRGYSSATYLKNAGFVEGENLVLVSYYQQLWQMLYKKRIDFVLTNTLTLENELKRSGLNPNLIIKRIHLTDYPSKLYFSANKTLDKHTASAISHALNTLKENGEYQAILTKWQLPLPATANKL
ncbi:ABC transporter substrate-binding protein [Pseudoalteromonas sp. MM1]|uniref:substrate-binding periplasmic protein n=1 Tax=Pseudoalteromonas sp. MM1 TaxID=3036714 RepID=UPI002572FC80|nr:transporter substrate-binding domain-containing protein [Pseudoalteromonas sp. MM1]